MARKSSTLDQLTSEYQQHFNALCSRMQLPKTRNKYERRTHCKARVKMFNKSFPKSNTYHQLYLLSN